MGYKLKNLAREEMPLPVGSEILHVMDVYGEPTLFANIDMEELETETRVLHMVESYKPVTEDIVAVKHLGSTILGNQGKVYHYFIEPLVVKSPKAKVDILNETMLSPQPSGRGITLPS